MRSNKKGFTLIETLVSALILGIGLVMMGAALYSGFLFLDGAKEISIASLAAQEEVETIRNNSYANILAMGASFSFTPSSFSSLESPTGTVTIDNIYSTDNIRRLSVRVTWTGYKGRSMSTTLVTLITNSGIDRQ